MGETDVNLVQRTKRQAHQLKVVDHHCYGYRTIKSCLEYLKIPVADSLINQVNLDTVLTTVIWVLYHWCISSFLFKKNTIKNKIERISSMGETDVNLVQRTKRQAHQLRVIDHHCYGYRTIKSCLEYLKIPVADSLINQVNLDTVLTTVIWVLYHWCISSFLFKKNTIKNKIERISSNGRDRRKSCTKNQKTSTPA